MGVRPGEVWAPGRVPGPGPGPHCRGEHSAGSTGESRTGPLLTAPTQHPATSTDSGREAARLEAALGKWPNLHRSDSPLGIPALGSSHSWPSSRTGPRPPQAHAGIKLLPQEAHLPPGLQGP